jgi:hypothetical protein
MAHKNTLRRVWLSDVHAYTRGDATEGIWETTFRSMSEELTKLEATTLLGLFTELCPSAVRQDYRFALFGDGLHGRSGYHNRMEEYILHGGAFPEVYDGYFEADIPMAHDEDAMHYEVDEFDYYFER